MTIDPQNLPNDRSIIAIKMLCHLAENPESNVTEASRSFAPIASKTSMVSASVHLFNLEKDGLVKRFRPADDRRQSLFTLTKKGHRLVHSWQSESLPLVFAR